MHRCLAAKVMECPVRINFNRLPVHGKDERGISGIVEARITDDPVGDDADRDVFAINEPLGKLILARVTFRETDALRTAPPDRLDHPFSGPGFARHGNTVLTEDLLGLHLVRAERHGHEPAAEVVRVLLEDHGKFREQVVGGDHEAHVARRCEPFDLSGKIAFIRADYLVAAPLETFPEHSKHRPAFMGKQRIMRGCIFCEQDLHLRVGMLPWKITLSDRSGYVWGGCNNWWT